VGLGTTSTEYPISTWAASVTSTIVNDDASVGIIGGSSSTDNLSGTAGNDSLYGYAGNDILYGLGGSDLLNGGTGADQLSGGAGKDVFVFAAGDSGQSTTNQDRILDFSKGLAGTGDQIDYSANLMIGGSSAAASSTQAAINAATGVATFASGSGTTLTDALSDIASRFTATSNSAGEFAFFKVNQTGNFYAFISDGYSGVTANDVVIELVGVTTINKIDLSLGNLSILS
jgi:Ca2+-binding RTX toxin-like protein